MSPGKIMGKIFLNLALSCALISLTIPAEAQQTKVIRIGVLRADSPSSHASEMHQAFGQGLHDLGYIEGKNLFIEYRYAEGKRDRLPELAAELVRLKVDVLVAVSAGATRAAKRATNTIPIVVGSAGDLVGDGLVASLARPGGNITGSTNVDADFSAKRLELLKESFPKLSHVAVLFWEELQGDRDELKETRAAAQPMGVRILPLEVKGPNQIPGAFGAMSKERAEALIITNNSRNFVGRRQLIELAAKNRLPTMCGRAAFVEAGALMSYAASRSDSFRRAAYFVDKILKGAKPADLPIEQPTKFEFVINLKTAKQSGFTIPPNVLARADKVIR